MNRTTLAQSRAKSNDTKSLYTNQTEKGLTKKCQQGEGYND
jgi:hypothetical protein